MSNLELKILSPTFIGSGNKLLPIEIYDEGKTVKVFKFDNLTGQIANLLPPEKVKNVMLNLSREISQSGRFKHLKEVLEELNLNVEKLNPDYTLEVEDDFQPSEVEEFIKTLRGVYVPGSEIKGAFRTAIFYHLLTKNDKIWKQFINELKRFLRNYNPRSLKPFAQHWENKIFSGKPLTEVFSNREPPKAREDLLKFLQVEDTEVKNPSEVLVLKTFYLRHSRRNLTVWVESLRKNTLFSFRIFWNSKGVKSFLGTYLRNLNGELKTFWEDLNEEELLKILNEFTRDLITFEIEKRKNGGVPRRQELNSNDYFSILEKLNRIKETQRDKEIETLERLKEEKGFLLRLGKYTGRYSHSVLLAVYKKDRKFFERELKKRFSSKTYWTDREGNPLGFCKVNFS